MTAKPTGWNNLAFPNVGMPHPLWELQGQRRAVFEEHESHGQKTHVLKGWEQVTPGTMTPAAVRCRRRRLGQLLAVDGLSRLRTRVSALVCGF